METIKTSSNVEFDVIYADGTRTRVTEGILWSVEDDAVTVHIGTSRLAVLFASIEDALALAGHLGVVDLLRDYLQSSPADKAVKQLFAPTSAQKQAAFRLGQMDMRESSAAKLRDAAANVYGIARATLDSAADLIDEMETLK